MIEILPATTQTIPAMKLSGMVSEEEIDQCTTQVAPRLEDERPDNILFDWENLDGWAPGARSVGTWFGMHHCAIMRRVAIIADAK